MTGKLIDAANSASTHHPLNLRRLAGVLDCGDAVVVFDLQVTAALENFERVLLVGQAETLGLLEAKQRDVARDGFPHAIVRGLPVEPGADAVAPLGAVFVEWRAAVVARRRVPSFFPSGR